MTNKNFYPSISISAVLDEISLSPEAFRVYFHLAKLDRLYERIFPSYKEIGSHCFPDIQEDSARIKAIKAVKELLEWNVIRVEKNKPDQEFYSNRYFLNDASEWRQRGAA